MDGSQTASDLQAMPAADLFREGGVFSREITGFVPREAQSQMATAVEEVLRFGGKLVAESGTGTGKTFAYLAPVLLSGRKTLVSTATKHLQEQIYYRDLPAVLRVLGLNKKVRLLKGRANYLCRHRLRQQPGQSDWTEPEHSASVAIIHEWSRTTRIGDIAEVPQVPEDSPVWPKVTSTAENCLGSGCPEYTNCCFFKARQAAAQADILIVNHHLFFSHIRPNIEGSEMLLSEYDAVIFDEAHTLPEPVSRCFGFSLSSVQLQELVADTISAEKVCKSGVDFNAGCTALTDAIDGFAAFAARCHGVPRLLDDIISSELTQVCSALSAALADFEAVLSTAAPAGEDFEQLAGRCGDALGLIDQWLNYCESDAAYWLESVGRMWKMHSTPLDLGRHLRPFIDDADKSWVFTSATLAVGDSFDAYCQRLGIDDAQLRQWGSPYAFQRNALVYLPDNLPDPRDETFETRLAQTILQITGVSRGRAFCLFTSHRMLHAVKNRIRERIAWPLFIQGESSKSQILENFLSAENAVLLGTASFREGVDVKGERLSCVIIDKLPFASPADPVFKQRLQRCEESGGNPFFDIQVPEAVIALKQGVGRLIRSETDRGILVLCDHRLISKSYGRVFLESLPPAPVTTDFADVMRFFDTAR